MENYIPISSINTYVYCPRRFYIEYFLGLREDNQYTLEGKNIQSELQFYGINGFYYKNLYVVSERFKIEGIIDIVIESSDRVCIVEKKHGKRHAWENDYFQVLAQILAFEETTNIKVNEAYIFYFESKKRQKIEVEENKITKLAEILDNMRKIAEGILKPAWEFSNKCPKCSELLNCFPYEIKQTNIFEEM
ncbi:CRISPR-associated protein Cas4 [Caldicellulosiruptor acetigenus]|uniref:CRISPR-associated exonuclease Cas4 n=1 Tax=Caldicellulosiruptor acetigenus 6A TaxID=632516 RepID=G2PT67_9FIRM|nr:CRISPR-associated protein Cas4 [Caldicellulosiruptor acetigenus]AEM74226.1 CRISPR-associated protein Cas4 [Caldicellulosiruptor acetigenus 6A]